MAGNGADVAIVGGGLVGLATAYALTSKVPDQRIVVLEAENEVARHQSGRNSGVLHSGVYYTPGSSKAKLCRIGARQMIQFCDSNGIALEQTGKVIVATDPSQVAALHEIARRGEANGLEGLRRVGRTELAELEPHVNATEALAVPEAGVVDFPAVARSLADLIRSAGHEIRKGFQVTNIVGTMSGFRITAASGDECEPRFLVNCAGLHSDRVATMAGHKPPVTIIPFRGEYFSMPTHRDHLVRNLVYPVPDPRFPFLGVHFTRRIDGTVEVGPNAVLAMGRHRYRDEAGRNWRDVGEMLRWPGLWRLGLKYWRTGSQELIRSHSKRLYAAAARKLIPAVLPTDLIRGGSGIRAQAVRRNGALADDFVIVEDAAAVHVLNAPSPAATACLAIGEHIANRIVAKHR